MMQCLEGWITCVISAQNVFFVCVWECHESWENKKKSGEKELEGKNRFK